MSIRRLVYSLVLYLILPFVFLRLWWRGRANPAYRQRWSERLALTRFPKTGCPVIVLHVVSVGETMAALPLAEQLLLEFPEHTLWLTSITPTGSDTVRRLLGERVAHSYLPYDLPDAVQRFLNQVQPRLFLVMETELWPNLYAACAQRHIPLLLLNARLSERSMRGYQHLAALVRETLQAITVIAARENEDARRFQQLGAPSSKVQVSGNIKFDLRINSAITETAQALRAQWGQRRVWVAGSTHAGEETCLLQVQQQLRQHWPDVLLILVPRHPERFDSVAELCRAQHLSAVRRSEARQPEPTTAVLLGDSMGELVFWYALADMAFIGGSLVDVGGHNPLEAAIWGVPVLTGPYTHNTRDIYPALIAVGGAIQVESASDLSHHLLDWLSNNEKRQAAGKAAQQFLMQHQGVVGRLMQTIRSIMDNE